MNRDKQLEIMTILDTTYSKKELGGTLKRMAVEFVDRHRELCLEEGIQEFHLSLVSAKSLTKQHLAILVAIPFCSKKLFNAFRNILMDEVRGILDELIWVDKLSHQEIKNKFDIIIYEKEQLPYSNARYRREQYTIKPEFGMFGRQIDSAYYNEVPSMFLFLPKKLRAFLSGYCEKPKEAVFHPVAELGKTDYVYQGEQDIFLELPRIVAYKGQQQIKTNTKGRPVVSTYSKMQRKLKLREFFPESPEKQLKNMRTGLLAVLISTVRTDIVHTNAAEQLKHLIRENYTKHFASGHGIINYLKGINYLNRYNILHPEQIILNIFKKMPINEWLTFENLENFIKYNFYDVRPMAENVARRRLYYEYSDENDRYSYKTKREISSGRYYGSVLVPYIKGTCYLFAAYGMLDIAYDTPDVEVIGRTTQSPYDGLKYIKVNSLGAYVLGNISDYETPDAISKSTIRLSDNSLTVIIDEDDITAPIVLEPYTERVSPNRFRTDYSFFLKNVVNKRQLNDKINLFKQSVKIDIPENWERFFKELNQKIDPLESVRNISVFHIPADNKELLQLIAKDPLLQQICFKAEGYHIIVSNKELPKFKKRLQEFGYLLS